MKQTRQNKTKQNNNNNNKNIIVNNIYKKKKKHAPTHKQKITIIRKNTQ